MSAPASDIKTASPHAADDSRTRYYARKSRLVAVSERMLRAYLQPYWKMIAVGMAANILIAASSGAMPWLLQQMIDGVFEQKNRDLLVVIPIAIGGIMIVRSILTYGSDLLLGLAGQRSMADLQRDLFSGLVHSDLGFVLQRHTGEYISAFVNDARRMRDSLNLVIVNVARHILTVIAMIGFIFYIDWFLASVFIVFVLPISLVVIRSLSKTTRKAAKKELAEIGNFSTFIADTLRGVRIVKAYVQEGSQIAQADTLIDRILRFYRRALHAHSASSPVIEMLAGVVIAGIVFYTGSQSLTGAITTGEFVAFTAAIMIAYQPLRNLAKLQVKLNEGVAAGERIFDILDRPRAIDDRPDAAPLVVKGGAIAFENVTFSYINRNIPAVKDVSIDIAPGQTVALVGASGAGKSTLFNLIPRFFDADSGSIRIDGQDIRGVTLASLRAATALVTQDPFLFDETIAHNIAYGRPDAERQAVEDAAKAANAHDFIAALPEGYDTLAGENGVLLSGGQKQRITIARAILKNAPILLLDEATSSLDTESEMLVQAALTALMQERTTLVIAHRLSTIVNADRIHVLNEGAIVESGTHAELLAAGNIYADLFTKQFDMDNDDAPDGDAL